MNTKFSILFVLILFFIPLSMLAVKSIRKQETKTVEMVHPVKEKTATPQPGHFTDDLSNPWHGSDIHKSSIPHPDEDGKPHHFHFNRFQKRRYRYFFLISSRLFLIILHVASLIFGYMACLH